MAFDRITADPGIMGGQPIIRGMRFPVKTVVRMVAGGMSTQQILAEHPDLEEADIRDALEFAAASDADLERLWQAYLDGVGVTPDDIASADRALDRLLPHPGAEEA